MATPPDLDVRRELQDALDDLAATVPNNDAPVWRAITAGRLLEAQLAGKLPVASTDPAT